MFRCTCVALALTVSSGACGVDVNTSPQPTSDPEADGGVGGAQSDGGTGDGAPGSLTACEEARSHSDLAWIQINIFDVSCTTMCHGASPPAAGMSLLAGQSHANLVDVPSTQFAGWKRVVPGNSGASMLMVQLGGEPGPALEGYMPWNQPRLCTEKIDAIRRWIVAGGLPE